MAPRSLSDDSRRALLSDLQAIATDADALWDGNEVLRRFVTLPLHDRIFDPQVMVIRGARGTGKSMIFHALRALHEKGLPTTALFPRAKVDNPEWVEGFAETGTNHPGIHEVEAFAKQASDGDLRAFWFVHLAARLMQHLMPSVFDGVPDGGIFRIWNENRHDVTKWAVDDTDVRAIIAKGLDGIEGLLGKQKRSVFVTYDHLDKIGLDDPAVRTRATRALLTMWTSLANRYRSLRPKIFVREDLFQQSTHRSADASKLRGRSISLEWDTQGLYRLLIRHMAAESPALAEWIQRDPHGVPLSRVEPFGLLPPDYLPETGDVSQQAFIERLVGDQMGRGITAGRPHRWIPGRLQDAHRTIAPRSLLTFVGVAAEQALRDGPQAKGRRLLHPDELRHAIVGTSQQHVDQTAEEHRVIWRLENLRGSVLLLDPEETAAALERPRPNIVDGFGEDGRWALDELMRIGVFRRRHDGRLDIPDIYRFAFGIKRKGGVARPR